MTDEFAGTWTKVEVNLVVAPDHDRTQCAIWRRGTRLSLT